MILICWRSVILEKCHQQAWQRSQTQKCAAMGNHLDPIMVFLLKMTTCYPLSRACDSAMALGLPDVLSVKNEIARFFPGSVSWKNHILIQVHYSRTVTNAHIDMNSNDMNSWCLGRVKINKHLWRPSF